MRIEKLENILNKGSFHSDLAPEVLRALEAKLKRSSIEKVKRSTAVVKPMLDFDEINKEAIKLAGARVKYPQNLPKGVVIAVRKESSAIAVS